MRQFAHKGFRIEQLSVEAKIIYSAFLFFALAAMLVSALYYAALVDNRPFEGAKEYYAGEVQVASVSPEVREQGAGPVIEFPEDMLEDESEPAAMLLTMSWRKLLEVTHFHLFTVPVFLLIIAHIFMLCPIRPFFRISTILSGVFSAGIHMAAPWIIYVGGASWAPLMPVTGIWMTASMLLLTLWPAWYMWRPKVFST